MDLRWKQPHELLTDAQSQNARSGHLPLPPPSNLNSGLVTFMVKAMDMAHHFTLPLQSNMKMVSEGSSVDPP